jgi:uncharacterized membrane protein
MAETATRRRTGTAAKAKSRRKPAADAKPAAKTKAAAKKPARKGRAAVKEHTPSLPKPNRFAKNLAGKAIKKLVTSALEAGAGVIRSAADRAAATGSEVAERSRARRLPIQRSIDIAVPIRVVWDEWIALESILEGVHTVTRIERDGNELIGRTAERLSTDWAAEVLDERERESFAWQSHQGSDCAGLITFHELGKRLTRVELNLDVVPTGVTETLQLASRLADHRTETELRRLKARLELINPDLYEEPQDAEIEEPEPDDRELEPNAEEEEPPGEQEETDEQDEAA